MNVSNKPSSSVIDARERYYQQVIEQLANALLTAFGIPGNEANLVSVIGYGDEANNREAMEHWIAIALQHPDYPMAYSALPHLVRRLGNVLSPDSVDQPLVSIVAGY